MIYIHDTYIYIYMIYIHDIYIYIYGQSVTNNLKHLPPVFNIYLPNGVLIVRVAF